MSLQDQLHQLILRAEDLSFLAIEKALNAIERLNPVEDDEDWEVTLRRLQDELLDDEPFAVVVEKENPQLQTIIEQVQEYLDEPVVFDEVAELVIEAYDFGREVGKWEHVFGRKA